MAEPRGDVREAAWTVVWRICTRDARTVDEAFSGDGPASEPKRWTHPGRRVVYCSASQPLALLEALVELPRGALRSAHVFRAEIPRDLAAHTVDAAALPRAWRATPAPEELRDVGARWLDGGTSAILWVPSVVVPAERNVLLSRAHRDFSRIRVSGPFELDLDPRLVAR